MDSGNVDTAAGNSDKLISNPHIKMQLLAEYEEWSNVNKDLLKLTKETICDDGRIGMHFSLENGETFTLFCPSQYPNYEDNFFVEATPSLQLWCNTINEFILDSDSLLTLETVLYKASTLYYKSFQKTVFESSSDSEIEAEEYMMIDEDSDEEWEHIICQKKKQWRLKEAQLRAVTKQPKTSDMFQGSVKDHPKQVFSNSGASGILTNDLIGIMKTSRETGINAEPIEDNIYRWSVFLSSFDSNGKLEQDLHQLQQMHGYNYIQLQLDFTMDLHPFYPPIVKVIRPRLQGCMMLRVASLLKLSCWNPARDMKTVLKEIKNYLEIWARVDLKSERNDLVRFPEAYVNIENYLLWLACVSEIPPRANHRFPEISQDGLKSYTCSSEKKKKQERNSFPAGTGFSSDGHTGWDINAFLAAQREKDKQIKYVLQKILRELKGGCTADDDVKLHCNIARGVDETYSSFSIPSCSNFCFKDEKNCTDCHMSTTISKKGYTELETFPACNNGYHSPDNSTNEMNMFKHTDETVNETHHNSVSPVDHMEDLYNILEASTLVPFIESKLQVDSFLEICQHTSVYRCIVDILTEITCHSTLVALLWNLPDQKESIYSLVSRLEDKAKAILVRLDKTSANGNIPKPVSDSVRLYETSDEEKLARDFYEMTQLVSTALRDAGLLTTNPGQPELHPLLPDGIPSNATSLSKTYKEALKEMQFLSCDIEVEGPSAHFYSSNFKVALPPNSTQVMRIAQEMAALSTALPLDLESAIFIRTDDAKYTLLRALITGPEGTPYSGGCFQFDIFFPPTFPASPPLVHLCTTGLGRARFSPNLYANGIVCLSLLGTWKGLQGEQWNPTSTLLQVLVSIQSLVLVAEPFFNEPGCEAYLGTAKGNQKSQLYNEEILLYTIKHAMVSQLKRPSSGFEEVIRAHFRIKKNRILQEIKSYMAKFNSRDLCNAYESLQTELDKLTCSPDSSMKNSKEVA